MNYSKRDFTVTKAAALDTLEDPPQRLFKWAIPYRAIAPFAMTCDALIILSLGILCGVTYNLKFFGHVGNIEQHAGFAAVVAALFIAVTKGRNLYTLPELLNLKSQIRRIATKWVGVFIFVTAMTFAMKIGNQFSRGATFSFAVVGLFGLIGARFLWRIILADGLSVRRFSGRKVVLITEEDQTIDSGLIDALTRHGLQMAQHFVLPVGQIEARRRKEIIAQAVRSVRGTNVDEIVVGANPDHWPEMSSLLAAFRVLPLPVNFIPMGPLSVLFKLSSHTIGDTVTIELQSSPRTWSEQLVKRLIDIVIAGTALLLLLPLFLMTAIAIKLDSPGPIIFRQRRRGFNGRPFKILKFRTMSVQEDGNSIIPASPNDSRVTRVGHWLRQTSIDELPQLLNVLQGSMSIVGPRPHAMAHDNEFDQLVGNYAFRHHVKPGITGWAQVNGFRGRMQTVAAVEERIKFDLWYIDNWSFGLDFKIMFMTTIEVMRGENAF